MAATSAFTVFADFTEKNSNNQENWQDANAALLELDKGLRSGKAGEQCESIVRFPNLFEKYPFPILINSASLKLAEVFRTGNNFMRLCILKVAQRSEKHLDKILNVDEFLRRIYSVIHSNDPVARAMTIRLLGSISPIIAERKNAHHSIRTGLDSHDQVELEAAIFATGQFCAQSSDFASGVLNKLATMIEGLTTPIEMKLKLVPIFGHMLHDLHMASKARSVCLELLKSYSACKFVVTILHTLSCLAAKSVSCITDQIELLLLYLKDDPRRNIKYQTLNDLKMLAKEASHMWGRSHIEELCHFLLKCNYDDLKLGGLMTLVTLSTTLAVDQFDKDLILQVCSLESSSSNLIVSAVSCQLQINIAVAQVKQSDTTLCKQAALAVEGTCVICCMEGQVQPLKICLASMNQLVDSHPESCTPLADCLVALLPTVQESVAIEMCHALVTMATQVPSALIHLRCELIDFFKSEVEQESSIVLDVEMRQASSNLLVPALTLIFQAHSCLPEENRNEIKTDIETLILEELEKLTLPCKYWLIYRTARQATRQGFHCLASKLFDSLSTKVASEHFYFWLNALKCFCEAESTLNKPFQTNRDLAESIASASSQYYKGLVSLKAAVTPSSQLTFQITYAKLRADLLQAHSLLFAACASMKSCPPPAIATAVAMTTGQDVHNLSHFATQISQVCQVFRQLGEKYSKLFQSSFDADPVSLENVEILQQSCFLVSHCINLLTKTMQESGFSEITDAEKIKGSDSPLSQACKQLYNYIKEYTLELQSVPVCHLQTEYLRRVSLTLLHVPFIFPKYFFQSRQQTIIKLALSPTPRSSTEQISVLTETQFALKVEGIIEHLGVKPGLYRSIKAVSLHVSWAPDERKQTQAIQDIKMHKPITSLEQTVSPHHDYFSAQFLLSFTTPATYVVMVTTSVVDDTGALWETGPVSSLQVKAVEGNNRLSAGSSRM
ncbi:integrator complex subunit 7 [Exaiptasia diaphana]|uniref:Integrator complex subunit 7 n=1 Tax=Exaiptasia diaphana TaxID=2652724 RepID=A0A913XT38_EXADI|nr:integrator complex subunit 7 [Exaiptasia diaphana]